MIGERIEKMNEEELVQTFLNLTDDEKLIKRDKDLIKLEFQTRMDAKGIKKLALEGGHVALRHQRREILNQTKVRERLADEIENFIKISESDSVIVQSWDTKEVQIKAMKIKAMKTKVYK